MGFVDSITKKHLMSQKKEVHYDLSFDRWTVLHVLYFHPITCLTPIQKNNAKCQTKDLIYKSSTDQWVVDGVR